MKRYWMTEDGRTNVTWGENELDKNLWHEVTKEEYIAAGKAIMARWAKMNGMG